MGEEACHQPPLHHTRPTQCPPNNRQGFLDLGSATVSEDTPGLRWSDRNRYCQNIENIDDQAAWSEANNYNPRKE